jgi:hypothetical protein
LAQIRQAEEGQVAAPFTFRTDPVSPVKGKKGGSSTAVCSIANTPLGYACNRVTDGIGHGSAAITFTGVGRAQVASNTVENAGWGVVLQIAAALHHVTQSLKKEVL